MQPVSWTSSRLASIPRWTARLLTATLLAAATLAAVSCNGPRYSQQAEEASADASTAVRIQHPLPATEVEIAAPLSGTVSSSGQVQIAFQVSGLVETVHVAEGDTVTRGQSLAQLDTRLFSAQHSQARGALEQAKATLTMLENGARPEEIAQAEASVRARRAQLEQLKADYERAKRLYSEGVIPMQELDRAASGYEQAREALASAEEQLTLVRKGPREEEIEQGRAAVLAAEGTLRQAATQLDYALLTAPVDGTVVMRAVEPGQTISAGLPVFELANLAVLEVATEVPEGDLPQVASGDEALISFPAQPGVTATGRVIHIAPSAQATTRGFPVTLEIEDPAPTLVPGLVALVTFSYLEPPEGVVVPGKAIIGGQVFIVENGKAVRRPVTVVLDHGDQQFVTGVSTKDQVIINGQHQVRDGSKVHIVDALGIEELTRLDAE
jgi:multidrug resistance efflux pump